VLSGLGSQHPGHFADDIIYRDKLSFSGDGPGRSSSRNDNTALFDAAQGKKTRALKDRAFLFLFLGWGLPVSSW
jgi:hypothetical protein